MHRNDAAIATEPQRMLGENELAKLVPDAGFNVHRALGPRLGESAHVHCLIHKQKTDGMIALHQHPLPLRYADVQLDAVHRSALGVEGGPIVEVESAEVLHPVHTAAPLTDLKRTGDRPGLRINFNEVLLEQGVRRLANGMPE